MRGQRLGEALLAAFVLALGVFIAVETAMDWLGVGLDKRRDSELRRFQALVTTDHLAQRVAAVNRPPPRAGPDAPEPRPAAISPPRRP